MPEPARTLAATNLASRSRHMARISTNEGVVRLVSVGEAAALQSFPHPVHLPAPVGEPVGAAVESTEAPPALLVLVPPGRSLLVACALPRPTALFDDALGAAPRNDEGSHHVLPP